MKSAEERAREFFPKGPQVLIDALVLSFKEYARDQRHLCAERICEAPAVTIEGWYPLLSFTEADNAVMNTPFPR